LAELEIHHEGHEHDPIGQRVGVLAALLAVFLAVVTILSHRTHTEAIIKKSESNDQWQYYQASRLKFHNLELGERLIGVLGANNPGAKEGLEQIRKDKQKYTDQAKELKEKADAKTEASEAPRLAIRFRRRPAGDRVGAQFALLHLTQDALPGNRRGRRSCRTNNSRHGAPGMTPLPAAAPGPAFC
jgi:hypothetical protein